MSFIKADDIEIDDQIKVPHRGLIVPVIVRDIEYRPRTLILQVETDGGRPLSVPLEYGTPIELQS